MIGINVCPLACLISADQQFAWPESLVDHILVWEGVVHCGLCNKSLVSHLISGKWMLMLLGSLGQEKDFKAFSYCSSEITLTCNIDKLQPCKNRDVVRRRPFGYFLSLVFSYSRECPSDVVIGLNSIVVYYVDVAEKA